LRRVEVAVVGAGPAGLFAALEAVKKGVEVTVFEEHPLIGEPNHCAGILSMEGLSRLGVEPSEDFIQHEIKGGRIYSPIGTAIEMPGKRVHAYVVARTAFDRYLAEISEDAGVRIETDRRVRGLVTENMRVVGVQGRDWSIGSKIVIDAEGAGGSLARKVGYTSQMDGVLAGVNAEVSEELEPNMVEVWLGSNLAPGLFAWVIPFGEKRARCGLACNAGDPFERLKAFLQTRFGRVQCFQPRRGVVLTSGPVRRTYLDGMLLVGDTAGQTKPTTGGGVILGGLCAQEAGRTAAEAVEASDYSSNFLQRYQRAWRSSFNREFTSMIAARRLLNRLSDRSIDGIFNALKVEGLEGVLLSMVDEGDMDMQSEVIRSALNDPRVRGVIMRGVGRFALGELKRLFNI